MLERGKGRIINVASEGGRVAMRDIAVYGATKAAVISFTSNLATEVGPAGVKVVAVCPAIMISEERMRLLSSKEDDDRMVATYRYAISRTSLGRASTPDEVANVIAYLATDAASYIHGTAISVGGGMST
jgi:3-oxoacyl-[acyl-carrier protein] reductase